MNPVGLQLLSGQPHEAERVATEMLAAADDPRIRVGRVRARVWLGHPAAAAEDARRLQADDPLHAIARALSYLANGQPSRGRAQLQRDPPQEPHDHVVFLLTQAELARATGDSARSMVYSTQAFTLSKPMDPRWQGFCALSLARGLADAGDLVQAGEWLRQGQAVFASLSPQSLALAEVFDARGVLARRAGEPSEAVLHHQQALALWSVLGEDAPTTGGCRFSLAQALHRTGDFVGALAEMQQAFLITQRAYGADHLDTWITRFELGRIEVDNGEMLDGFPRMEAARAEVAKRLGVQHPVVRSMDRLL